MTDNNMNPLQSIAGSFQRPEEERDTLSAISDALAAFGAGVQGRLPEYREAQEGRRYRLSQQRQQAAAQDLIQARDLLSANNFDGLIGLANNRAQIITELGGDPTDTLQFGELANMAAAGDVEAANFLRSEIDGGISAAVGAGIIKDPQGDARSLKVREDANRLARERLEETRLNREQQQSQFEQTQERLRTKLSAASENELSEAQKIARDSNLRANRYTLLADDFERAAQAGARGGLVAKFDEFLKSATGQEDALSLLRREAAGLRASQVVNNLPPGAASDKDVELALSGTFDPEAKPEIIAQYLRGLSKLARLEQEYNTFKSDYISDTGSIRGLNTRWRSEVYSSELDQNVPLSDIYSTASAEGKSPEEVARDLGVSSFRTRRNAR